MLTPSQEARKDTAERQVANSLSAAMLLAVAGGSLDAAMYLTHGRVFAASMTGNAVLGGIAALSHNRTDLARHLLPMAGFVAGVWSAKVLDDRLVHHAIKTGLLAEIIGLAAASFLPHGFPELVFIPLIALLASYQIGCFRTVNAYAYNSTFITGNLRTLVDGVYEMLDPAKRNEGRNKAGSLGLVIVSFIAGAIGGAVLAPRFYNRALWLPVSALLTVLGLVVWKDWRVRREG